MATIRLALSTREAALQQQSSFFQVRRGIWKDHELASHDLIERTRAALQRAGVTKRDPLAPVVQAQGEMLVRQTQLFADLIEAMRGISEQQAGSLGRSLDHANEVLIARVAEAKEAMRAAVSEVQTVANITVAGQRQAQKAYERTFREAALEAMQQWSYRRIWVRMSAILLGILLLLTLAVWGAYSEGHSLGHQEALAAIKDTVQQITPAPQPAPAASHLDDKQAAQQATDLKNWRTIAPAVAQCETHPDFRSGRTPCDIQLWAVKPKPEVVERQPRTRSTPMPVAPVESRPIPPRTKQPGLFDFPPGWPKSIGHFGP